LSVTGTGGIGTRYRTVTSETYPKRRDVGLMTIELALSLPINQFEHLIEHESYVDIQTVLKISANGPSRQLADDFKCTDTNGRAGRERRRRRACGRRGRAAPFRGHPLVDR
jgi:hypothetical protein